MPENNTTKQPRRENPPPISPPSRLTTYIGTPPLSGDNGSVSRIAYVEIDGATYTVSGSPEVAPEDFTRMVQAQAEKIRQR